jgi:hypothetical protein
MSLVTIRCPNCGRELNVPEDSGKIVCMYCAEPIDAGAVLREKGRGDSGLKSLMEQAEGALLPELFTTRLDAGNFTASSYSGEFERYQALFRPALGAFQQAALVDADAAADRFAEILVRNFSEEASSKKQRDLFGCRFTITSLTIPAILAFGGESAEKAADCFLKKWKERFPKDSLGKATYDDIAKGFKRKLCYITTAVCGSLGKGDDCAELNEFRAFRDRWLAGTPGGKEKIAEYYLFAPLIVRKIDRSGQPREEYRRIWSEYLAPCLREIRAGRRGECARDYERMVRALERKWLS